MKLSELAGEKLAADPEIVGLTADSRAVRPGWLFAAMPGVNFDGAKYIAAAEANGAAAILARPGAAAHAPLIADENPRRRFALMAARFYASQPRTVVGVTGTNGKTSTALFSQQLWSACGRKAGSLGTVGAHAPGFSRKLAHTTPEPATLHETLRDMTAAGVTHLAMEVSSHAIAQHRADGVRFAGAAFSNITQDHLDYHADFADYFAAKLRLFTMLVGDGGFAVVNMDGEGAVRVVDAAEARKLKVLRTGASGGDIVIRAATPHAGGIALKVDAFGAAFEVDLPLIGAFQAENAALAAGIATASGEAPARVIEALGALNGAPGRMQHAADCRGGSVYVDYAHTPDAVTTALAAIRPHASGRVIAIIGAGGDRDRKKRPLMGAAAAAGADIVIVADDNPRSEDPASIRREVLAGAADAIEIGDRARAIAEGVGMLGDGDVLLIMGKGHETGQIVGGEILPFDDLIEARKAAGAGARARVGDRVWDGRSGTETGE